jgi:hypothetical protein
MESQEPGAPNGQREEAGARTFGERAERVGDTAQHAWSRTRDALTDVKETLDVEGRVDRHPYGTLAAAVGIGYVLGGGLFSPLTARILGLALRIGIRLAALPVLKEERGGLAQALGDGASAAGDEGGVRSARKTRTSNTNKGR